MKNVLILIIVSFFSAYAYADVLNFTVSNFSKSNVFFASTDYFDFGQGVAYNQTVTHTYNHPPKNIKISLGNGAYSSFYVMTDPSCDILGFAPMRKTTYIQFNTLTTNAIRYSAGNVNITISDMENSTVEDKKIKCSIQVYP